MVVLRQTKTPRILIHRTGPNGPFGEIAESLRVRGYQVTEWESSRIGAHSTDQDVHDQVKDIDIAFLVIRQKDTMDNGGPIRPLHRILVEAGLMQGKMEVDRVVLLVEDSVDGLSADTGLSSIRFSPDRPESVVQELISRVETLFPNDLGISSPPPPGAEDRIAIATKDQIAAQERIFADPAKKRAQSEEFWVAVRLGGLVFLAGFLVLLLAAFFLLRPEEDADGSGEVAADVVVLEPGLARRTLAVEESVDIAGQSAIADEDGPVIEAPEAVIGNEPAAPEATRGAANQLFPATCQLNMRKGSLLDGAVRCDGAGQLELEGHEGPWHNEVAAIATIEGVGATVEFELRDDGTTVGPTVQELAVGTTILNSQDAAFGISTLTVQFSGNGQHLHLFQRDADGGRSATLTFTLDR